MTVETKDILLKAAEDVTQGMWCKGDLFKNIDECLSLDQMLAAKRCAIGSLVVSNRLLGGTFDSEVVARRAVERVLRLVCGGDHSASHIDEATNPLAAHNDNCLPDDPFDAGQQLAELFRTTAESL